MEQGESSPQLNSTKNDTNEINKYDFYETEQLAVLWVLFLLIVLGNSSVLLALAFNKNRKSRMNYFIMQLAIADLAVGLISVLTDIVWRITITWHAGNLACKVIRYLQVLVTYSSTYVLVALSIDRYDAIKHPMKFSGGWRRARLLVAVAWVLSGIFSLPILIIFEERVIQGQKQCWVELPEPWHWQLYMSLVAMSLFFIPTIIITACYTVIVSTIWRKGSTVIVMKRSYRDDSLKSNRDGSGHDSLRRHYGSPRNESIKTHRGSQQNDSLKGHRNNDSFKRHRGSYQNDSLRRHRGSQQSSISSRRSGSHRQDSLKRHRDSQMSVPTDKVRLEHEHEPRRASSRGLIPKAKVKTIKMTFVIVFVFVVCWSPYFMFDLLQVYGYIPATQSNTALATFIQSLAPLNSAANPLIYCLFSTRICRTLRRIPPCSWVGRAVSEFCPGLVAASCLTAEHSSTLTSSLQSSRGSRLSSKHVTVL